MADADDVQLALVKYRLKFPGENGSGLTGEALGLWIAEFDRVSGAALAGVRITSTQFEGGGSSSGALQFDPRDLLTALLQRRVELEPAFDAVAFAPAAVPLRAKRNGFLVVYGEGC